MLAREADPPKMTSEEYLEWEALQDEKWELVDGHPVRRSDHWSYDPATGMAGATRAHSRIVANLIISLGTRLRGGPCFPLPSDVKLHSGRNNGRYPDVSVDCGSSPLDLLLLAEPRVLFEVLSASNTLSQQLQLLDDYRSTAAVSQIVGLEQDLVSALLWTREGEGWRRDTIDGVDAALELDFIGVSLPLAEIYKGLDFGTEPPHRANVRRPQ